MRIRITKQKPKAWKANNKTQTEKHMQKHIDYDDEAPENDDALCVCARCTLPWQSAFCSWSEGNRVDGTEPI